MRRASKYLHETVHQLVDHYQPETIIDLGSGYGGLPLKLYRSGYNITATDLNPKQDQSGMQVKYIDLNKPTDIKDKYDLVICTEVIEHLYSPKLLFQTAHKLLNENGIFIFSTPNNQNWFGRTYFLFTGKFPFFIGQERRDNGLWFEPHITPIFTWQVKQLTEGLFNIEKTTFNRSVLPLIHINLPIKNLMFGQNLIMVLRKNGRENKKSHQ